jgi:hypothetical protein
MYAVLLWLHSATRWLVLLSLFYAIYTAARGYSRMRPFTGAANRIRHWTATFAHLQLTIGMILYFQSPIVKLSPAAIDNPAMVREISFFKYLHIALMLLAVIMITIGSAAGKRAVADRQKYRIMLYWFAAALLMILLAIPWPFSPFADRPYIRIY